MFLDYYQLREQPFGVTPDPRFLYFGNGHREALASIVYGMEANRGFMALIAPPGMGKTSLLFHMLERLADTARTVYLFQTQCDSRELLRYILRDLGENPGDDLVSMHEQLNQVLLRQARSGQPLVLIIDEAQNLTAPVLETVRLLTDFETTRQKLLQVILAGQPQLGDTLVSRGLEQLRQRISIIAHIEPLRAVEVQHYIDHRLAIAGYRGERMFTREAVRLIAEASGGLPRNVNNLCFGALSVGCALRQKTIGRDIVQEAIEDQHIDHSGFADAPPSTVQSTPRVGIPIGSSMSPVEVSATRRSFALAAIVTLIAAMLALAGAAVERLPRGATPASQPYVASPAPPGGVENAGAAPGSIHPRDATEVSAAIRK